MDRLETIGKNVHEGFRENRSVLSFAEYLKLVQQDPRRHARNAAQYARDMFDHFGVQTLERPTGRVRRFNLFDAPWEEGEDRLVGEEEVQNAIYRILNNFVRQGKVDRFILLHGPNGSSKSTITDLFARAMEHYSTLDVGALYRFNWIFPNQAISRSGIGFASSQKITDATETYAYLEDEAVDALLTCELHDHPLLLIPRQMREPLLDEWLEGAGSETGGEFLLSDYILGGGLCHKCKLVYEALLKSYQGDYLRVLRHVRVERFFVSRRYREAFARVEPQLAVDATARQVTADRSLGALPTALQSINLFEFTGDLVQANRGAIDYPDMLKRPVEAFKYLINAVEDGQVVLDQTNLFFDMIFLGSTNEMHLNAFMESPEWMSFKARMELVSVPYLLDFTLERQIYDEQIGSEQVGKHIAPQTTAIAALWAVLTRMHKPDGGRFGKELKDLVAKLTPMAKAELYGRGKLPDDVKGEDAKALKAGIPQIFKETWRDVLYEGRTGASPREVKTAIMNAAQNTSFDCLSPSAVLDELRALVQESSVYAFLRMEPKDGFYDHKQFIEAAETWHLDRADQDIRMAIGLVEEASYGDLFARYLNHVTHHVRKEKIRNPVTGAFEAADVKLMLEVEKELNIQGDPEEFRQNLMTKIGAWSVDHSGKKPDYSDIFPDHFDRLQRSYYERQKKRVMRILRDAVLVLTHDDASIADEHRQKAQQMLDRLKQEFKYCDHCARETITRLLRTRYAK